MPKYKLGVTLKDAYNRKTTKEYGIEAADIATASTLSAAFVSDMAVISMARVLEYRVSDVTDYTDTVDAGANVNEGLTFSLSIGGVANKSGYTKVPAPIKTVVNSDGTVDMTATAVSGFASHFLSGFVLVSDGEVVDSFNTGKLDR